MNQGVTRKCNPSFFVPIADDPSAPRIRVRRLRHAVRRSFDQRPCRRACAAAGRGAVADLAHEAARIHVAAVADDLANATARRFRGADRPCARLRHCAADGPARRGRSPAAARRLPARWRRSRMRSMHSPNSRRVRAGSCRTARSRCSSRWFGRRCSRRTSTACCPSMLPASTSRRRSVYQLAVDRLQLAAGRHRVRVGERLGRRGCEGIRLHHVLDQSSLAIPIERHAPAPDFIVGSLAHIAPIVRQMVISP